MSDVTAMAMVRGLYDYHRWANRRLFDHAAGLGEAAAARDLGAHFSHPTLVRMFGHLYGADWVWLMRWKGQSPTSVPGAEFTSLEGLRKEWDALESEQAGFVQGLTDAGLGRVVDYRSTEGRPYRAPLWALLQHVANHATHHRSEIATMITLIAGSPPDTGINTYVLRTSGQA